MIEREIVRLLKTELARLAADQWRLPRHMANLGLNEDEAQTVRNVLAARQTLAEGVSGQPAPFVFQTFARLADARPPFYAVSLIDDREGQGYLGGVGSVVGVDEAEILGDVSLARTATQAAAFTSSYGVMCAASDNVDVCIYLYEVAKMALVRGRSALHAIPGTYDVRISGQDQTVNPRYEPMHLFLRQVTVTVSRVFEAVPHEPESFITGVRTSLQVRADGTGVDDTGGLWVRISTTE